MHHKRQTKMARRCVSADFRVMGLIESARFEPLVSEFCGAGHRCQPRFGLIRKQVSGFKAPARTPPWPNAGHTLKQHNRYLVHALIGCAWVFLAVGVHNQQPSTNKRADSSGFTAEIGPCGFAQIAAAGLLLAGTGRPCEQPYHLDLCRL